jgi:heme/copper-type cytochrome/quinol oxidase subunit 2
MRDDNDNNYVSMGGWMLMMLVTAIPVIGWIMIFVWAFTGENQTRKNYYRAILCWILIMLLPLVCVVIYGAVHGNMPAIQKLIQDWTHKT